MTYKPLGGIVIAVAINKLQVEVEVEPSPIGPNPPTAKAVFGDKIKITYWSRGSLLVGADLGGQNWHQIS